MLKCQPMPTYTSLNFFEFFTAFPTEESCEEHLIRIRWRTGMPCKKCGGTDFYKRISTRRAYQCRHCRSLTSPTAGTLFHRTRTPLRAWFLAIFCVAFDKRGLSALQLSKQIGVDYDTAFLRPGHLPRSRRTSSTAVSRRVLLPFQPTATASGTF